MYITLNQYEDQFAASVRDLFLELQIHEYQFDGNKSIDTKNIENYIRELFEEIQHKNGEMLVAIVNEQCVGLIAWYLENEPEFTSIYGYISDMVVFQPFRGMGIGQQLLNTAIDHIRNTNAVRIHIGCLQANTDTKSFYSKNGFSDYSVVMTLSL